MSSITDSVAKRFPRGWQSATSRLKLWINQAVRALNIGKMFSGKKNKFMWRRGGTSEPCKDCLDLDGTIKTAEEWIRAGIEPQSPDLECGGWNCLCQFVPVR